MVAHPRLLTTRLCCSAPLFLDGDGRRRSLLPGNALPSLRRSTSSWRPRRSPSSWPGAPRRRGPVGAPTWDSPCRRGSRDGVPEAPRRHAALPLAGAAGGPLGLRAGRRRLGTGRRRTPAAVQVEQFERSPPRSPSTAALCAHLRGLCSLLRSERRRGLHRAGHRVRPYLRLLGGRSDDGD